MDQVIRQYRVSPTPLNIGVANRLKEVLGEQSPEWIAAKQGLARSLMESGEGETALGTGQVAQRMSKFLNSDMASVMYTPEERTTLRSYADLNRQDHDADRKLLSFRAAIAGRYGCDQKPDWRRCRRCYRNGRNRADSSGGGTYRSDGWGADGKSFGKAAQRGFKTTPRRSGSKWRRGQRLDRRRRLPAIRCWSGRLSGRRSICKRLSTHWG